MVRYKYELTKQQAHNLDRIINYVEEKAKVRCGLLIDHLGSNKLSDLVSAKIATRNILDDRVVSEYSAFFADESLEYIIGRLKMTSQAALAMRTINNEQTRYNSEVEGRIQAKGYRAIILNVLAQIEKDISAGKYSDAQPKPPGMVEDWLENLRVDVNTLASIGTVGITRPLDPRLNGNLDHREIRLAALDIKKHNKAGEGYLNRA